MYAGDAALGGVPAAESDPGEVKGLRPLLELVRKSPGFGRGACSRVSSRALVRWAWERGRATARGRDGQFTGARELRLWVPGCQTPRGCTSRMLRARGSETRASGAWAATSPGSRICAAVRLKRIAQRTCILFSALTQQVQWLAFWWVLTSTFHTILGREHLHDGVPEVRSSKYSGV
jgi:hypothetical protein